MGRLKINYMIDMKINNVELGSKDLIILEAKPKVVWL